jgi:hypothetical protein
VEREIRVDKDMIGIIFWGNQASVFGYAEWLLAGLDRVLEGARASPIGRVTSSVAGL